MKILVSVMSFFFLLIPSLGYAADNPLSVHVLNLQDGLPSPDIEVSVEKMVGDKWQLLNSSKTDSNGRITALYPSGKEMTSGTYKVTFQTGKWFKQNNQKTFFPEVPVIFTADEKVDHLHIPLLLSPFGYSTYRGN